MTAVLFTESSRNLGGQELQILLQMQLLQRAGFRAALACRPGSQIGARASALGLETVPVGFRNAGDPLTIARLATTLRRLRPAAVLCHSGHDASCVRWASSLAPGPRRLVRVRTYLAGHPSTRSLAAPFFRTLVPSEFLKRTILAANPQADADRVRVLYPIVDLDRLAEEARSPLSDSLEQWLRGRGRAPLIVHPAMLRPEKGHREFLAVLAALRERLPDFTYIAAGQGDLLGSLQAEAERLGLAGHVYFPGLVTPVAALLARADLVVLPSLAEPLGLAQVEAMALGRPVVASDVGGIPETIESGRTGLLVAPGDIDGWVNAIIDSLDTSATVVKRTEAARAAVQRQFSPAQHYDRLLHELGIPVA